MLVHHLKACITTGGASRCAEAAGRRRPWVHDMGAAGEGRHILDLGSDGVGDDRGPPAPRGLLLGLVAH
eukprot:1748126-Pyramimonas_sp.AAC.1